MMNEAVGCPYFSAANGVCAASPSSRIPPRAHREGTCGSEDFESCASFLGLLLSLLALRSR